MLYIRGIFEIRLKRDEKEGRYRRENVQSKFKLVQLYKNFKEEF